MCLLCPKALELARLSKKVNFLTLSKSSQGGPSERPWREAGGIEITCKPVVLPTVLGPEFEYIHQRHAQNSQEE